MNTILNRINHSRVFAAIFLALAATLIFGGFVFWVAAGLNFLVALSMGAGFFMLASYKMKAPGQE